MNLKSIDEHGKRPACFGLLDKVFPKGDAGLRTSPGACLECPDKTECLKTAMGAKEGLKVKGEFVDKAYYAGAIGFMERWSRKKSLYYKIKEKKE